MSSLISQLVRVASIGAFAGLLVAGCATQVSISGRFPARFPEAARLKKLAVVEFSGVGGGEFTSVLQSALFGAEFDGQRVFTIVDTGGRTRPQSSELARYGRGAGADGVVTGQTSVTWNNEPYDFTRTECTQRDEKKKCVRESKVHVYCTRRTIALSVSARLVRSSNGETVYSSEKSDSAVTSWCSGETRRQSDDMMLASLRINIAEDVRRDVAPYVAVLKATLKESPTGLPPLQAAEFRRAVDAAKAQNFGMACEIWAGINATPPQHVWTVYNLGVCAETEGAYGLALTRYRTAQSLSPKPDTTISQSITRVTTLLGASAQLEAEKARQAEARPAPAAGQKMCTVKDKKSGLLVRQPC